MSLWGDLAGLAGGLLGANMGANAIEDSGQASLEAAKIAADAAKFRPYGVTTGFGQGWFNPETQQAGYQLDPALAAYRDQNLMGAAITADQINLDPTQATQNYFNQAQDVMAPMRAQKEQELRQNMFGSGRLGMRLAGEGAGAGAGGMYQPDALGYNKAQALADQQLAITARDKSQADIDNLIRRSQGMFSYGTGLEKLGMTPLDMGSAYGAQAASAGGNAGTLLMSGANTNASAIKDAGMGWGSYIGGLGQKLGTMDWNKS